MIPCNRRIFMTRIVVGTAALAAVGRVYADAPATPAAAPGTTSSCGECEYYTATPGESQGACAFAGKTVSADGGCGAFTERKSPGV